MEYEGWICRGPMERGSYMLPISVGCSYNGCRFCMLFKHLTYRELPMEQVENELLRVKRLGGHPKRVFLGDGNAFCASTERLREVLTLVKATFPEAVEFRMDSTVPAIAEKSDAELRSLRALGVGRLYLGIESGLDDVLSFMKKDHTPGEARRQIERLHAVGIEYGAHIMSGVAGAGRGLENARATAEFLNETCPAAVINFSLFLHRGSPLYKCIERGEFAPADELENLREEELFLSRLNCECDYEAFHDFEELRLHGRLPSEREKLLAQLRRTLAETEKKEPFYAWTD